MVARAGRRRFVPQADLDYTSRDQLLRTIPGQWNSTQIVVRGNHVEHWLTDQRIVSWTLGRDDWMLRVRDSKFASVRDYGRAPQGLIGLQGTNNGSREVRDMRIRVLP